MPVHVAVPANAVAQSEPSSGAEKYFSDVELIDQNGRKVRFYNDVLKGKTVVINALFTTCPNVCPPMSRNFERIQAAVGERLGKDVFLVSITVDPENDDPEVLAEYARSYDAGEDWLFLTAPDSVVQALAIDVFNLAIAEGTDPEEPIIHSSRFILVDAAGRIRGYYEGTTDEGLGELLKGIRKLEAERGN